MNNIIKTKTGVYEGETLRGKRHGKGIFKWNNGNWFDGEWLNGRRDGRGVYHFKSGARVEGKWKKDKKDGKMKEYTSKTPNRGKIVEYKMGVKVVKKKEEAVQEEERTEKVKSRDVIKRKITEKVEEEKKEERERDEVAKKEIVEERPEQMIPIAEEAVPDLLAEQKKSLESMSEWIVVQKGQNKTLERQTENPKKTETEMKMDEMKRKNEILSKECIELKSTNENLENEVGNLKKKNEILSNECIQLKSTNESHEEKVASLKSRNLELGTRSKNLEGEVARLIARLKSRIDESARNENGSREGEISMALKSRILDLEDQNERKKEDIELLKEEITLLKDEISIMKGEEEIDEEIYNVDEDEEEEDT